MELVKFSLRNVRCFSASHDFRIRPLTLLVGENSTGKTTALGCFQVLASYLAGGEADFNRDPYEMGTAEHILSCAAEDNTFALSFTLKSGGEEIERTVEFINQEDSFEPVVKRIITKFSDGQVVFDIGVKDGKPYDAKTKTYRVNFNFENMPKMPSPKFLSDFLTLLMEKNVNNELSPLKQYIAKKTQALGTPCLAFPVPLTHSPKPVRSRPQRSYDALSESADVELVDMSRMQIHNPQAWQRLLTLLQKFGRGAQMFDSLRIENFDKPLGNPFQVLVTIDGAEMNIRDVGYGVSQVLPVLYRLFAPIALGTNDRPATLLFQQPEVHLHPKAEAALASTLASTLVTHTQQGRSFVVETHSRNIIDRVRIEIMQGNVDPDDVSLIYLQPKHSATGRVVTTHNITFDSAANMIGEPPHYAEFLMQETGRMFGFKD